jgi:MFS family permease
MTNSPARARWAVFAIFMLHGMLVGSWTPHVPLAKDRLDVGPAVLGLALLAIAGGAVLAMPIAGALINRFGSARMILISGLVFAVGFFGPTLAPTLGTFVVSGIVLGAGIGALDVAMNSHGLAVEKEMRRPILSGLHGAFSIGAMIGAFAGAALVQWFGPGVQVFTVVAVFLAGLFVAVQYLLPASIDRGLGGSHFAMPTSATLVLGSLCFLALVVEGSVMDWAAIFMHERFLLEVGVAALAFGFYQGGMAASRLGGDWMRQRFGSVNVVVTSALLAAFGTGLALVAPSIWLTFLAFTIGGVGIGNVAPMLFAGGGRLEPDAPGRGIAAVTTMGYAGFLTGPPLIGFAAQLTNLQIGLGLTVLASIVIAIFAKGVAAADSY